jgi:hypothetical protein
MDYVSIQIQDYGGNWKTVSNVVNNLQRIIFELRSVTVPRPARPGCPHGAQAQTDTASAG